MTKVLLGIPWRAILPSATSRGHGDPLFTDAAWGTTGDYHLASGSPAVDHGDSTSAPAADLEGRIRPQGSAPDMGCYER